MLGEDQRKIAQGLKYSQASRHPLYNKHRAVSWQITRLLYALGVGSTTTTILVFLSWGVGLVFLTSPLAAWSPAFFYLSFLFDKCDGELARIRGAESIAASYSDELFHIISIPLLIATYKIGFLNEYEITVLDAGAVLYLMLKFERKVHYKYHISALSEPSTIAEWPVQDDVLIFALMISILLFEGLFPLYIFFGFLVAVAWRIIGTFIFFSKQRWRR